MMLPIILDHSCFSWSSARELICVIAYFQLCVLSASARAQTAAVPAPRTSQPVTVTQTEDSGRLSFEVASIRPGDPGKFIPPTIDMSNEDTPITPGGAFIADFPLPVYVEFAYKILLTHAQEQAMIAHLPKWVSTQPFVIEAKAPAEKVTKDQMRVMMQSLLADRFKLATHFETHDQAALALVLTKPGTRGPRLRPHSLGLACDSFWMAPPDRTAPSVPPGGFLPTCGVVVALNAPNHTVVFGARNVTMQSIAGNLATLPAVAEFGRPVLDQTGLAGTYDFSLSWLPDGSGSAPGAAEPPDAQGPPFFEALKEQLGLKLKPTRAPVRTVVIDHVEELSPN
jgi:uncharacterized protein (TIGR03435 family)